jgi:hypothetical protein
MLWRTLWQTSWPPVGLTLSLFICAGAHGTIRIDYDRQPLKTQSQSIAPPISDTASQSPDTTGVWYHIRQKQRSLANQEMARLKTQYPHWQPGVDLLEALGRLNRPQHPPKTEHENRADRTFGRLSQGNEKDWQALSPTQFQQASDLAFQGRNPSHHILMGWIALNQKAYAIAVKHFKQARKLSAQADVDEGIRTTITLWVTQAIKNRDETLLRTLISQYLDIPVAEIIDGQAWAYYDAQDYRQALFWFKFTDNREGQTYTLDHLKEKSRAMTLACANMQQQSLRTYCIDGYAQQQAILFNDKHYRKSLDIADKIKQYQPLNQAQSELVAWAHYHLGHRVESTALFKQLLTQDPENTVYAEILVEQLIQKPQQLETLAGQYPLIADVLKIRQQKLAWQRKQFDRAYDLDDPRTLALRAREKPTLETGIDWRTRSSDDPLGDLQTIGHYLGFSSRLSHYRIGAKLHYQRLKSGTPGTDQWVWQGPATEPFTGLTQTSETALSASIKRQYQQMNTLFTLTYHHPADHQSAALTGKLSAVWFNPQLIHAATLYRTRQSDSLLSTTGIYGDASRQVWGGVVATGIKNLAIYQWHPRWSLSTELKLARLTGEQVKNNEMYGLRVGLSHAFTIDGENVDNQADNNKTNNSKTNNSKTNNNKTWHLDALRAGPFIDWSAYRHNLNAYTQGNGGYFSPKHQFSLGGEASLLTAEAQPWQIRSRASLSYTWIKPGDIARFPLSEGGEILPQQSNQGIGANWQLEGQWLISSQWVVAGYIEQTWSPDFHETQAGIGLQWHFSTTRGVTSDTLPFSSPDQTEYAWY